jgi:hypothetical protein
MVVWYKCYANGIIIMTFFALYLPCRYFVNKLLIKTKVN